MQSLPPFSILFLVLLSSLHVLPASARECGGKEWVNPQPITQSAPNFAPPAGTETRERLERSWFREADYDALLMALAGMRSHGLEPEHYRYTDLMRLRHRRQLRATLATTAWLEAAQDVAKGRRNPGDQEDLSEDYLLARLESALATGTIASSLNAVAPRHPEYRRLISELARLRHLREVELEKFKQELSISHTNRPIRITYLQDALIQSGYLARTHRTGIFDTVTRAGVKALQAQNHLRATGNIGVPEINILQRQSREKETRIIANLERWRWLPSDVGYRHLRVNVPDYSLTAHEGDIIARTHRVIIGKTTTPTPIFSGKIEYVVFNPNWQAPGSMASSPLARQIRGNPTGMEALGYRIVTPQNELVRPTQLDWAIIDATPFAFHIRQLPGPNNAMGRVKFIFPNPDAIYIHDTPDHSLFASDRRAQSLGCLRVEHPLELAEWILRETPGWAGPRIDREIAEQINTKVDLAWPLPVHIVYFTAVPQAGGVRYLHDIYELDARLFASLRTR